MFLGGCLRFCGVPWISLLFCLGNCFPTDHGNKTTSLNSGSSATPDSKFASSSVGNESNSTIEVPVETTNSNSTSAPDTLSPRAFYVGSPLHAEERSAGFSMQPLMNSTPRGLYPLSNPWFGPFHEAVYPSPDSHPYTYGDGSRGFPYYNYGGIHAASLPYGYNYGTAGSPHYSYAYGMNGLPLQAYDHRMSASPPYGVGPSPPYGYLPWQPSVLDPELFLIGNVLMEVREMPLAQAGPYVMVPVGMIEPSVYPPSHLMQSNGGYHRAGDLLSDNLYSSNDYSLEPETDTMKQQDVPETDF
ncbi:uncharacterized protein LOC116708731 [Xiphophorus hellerii]|uniref:uncharacterized protein LOC116708731 n=1 Tax=Xiphophorus hellerii TaxID=8084 RepID=UPI0013B3A363|nr:uncharacterized protein LOC116708731 [Xiphophorus hellerii]